MKRNRRSYRAPSLSPACRANLNSGTHSTRNRSRPAPPNSTSNLQPCCRARRGACSGASPGQPHDHRNRAGPRAATAAAPQSSGTSEAVAEPTAEPSAVVPPAQIEPLTVAPPQAPVDSPQTGARQAASRPSRPPRPQPARAQPQAAEWAVAPVVTTIPFARAYVTESAVAPERVVIESETADDIPPATFERFARNGIAPPFNRVQSVFDDDLDIAAEPPSRARSSTAGPPSHNRSPSRSPRTSSKNRFRTKRASS